MDKKAKVDIDELLRVDEQRRELMQKIEEINREKNTLTKETAEKGRELKQELTRLKIELDGVDAKFFELMNRVPNIPSSDTPIGPDESGNKVLRVIGKKPELDFKPKEHWEIGKALDIIDNERAAVVTGARFTYLKREAALLQFAIIQFTLQVLTSEKILKKIAKKAKLNVNTKPFIPVVPPVMIRPEVMQKMARLEPRDERYHIPSDDLYLVGSAEHTLGPMHMNETFEETDLPLRYVGYSTAFRREAGSYGKDTKGILRVHQFDKIEMESFGARDQSTIEQDFIVAIQEYLVSALGLSYRVVQICTGDMGGPDARQIDIETWMPGQNTYRETHTSDMMTDYQSRQLSTKYKDKKTGKAEFVHMNDATAFAIGRILIAIIENYQQKDGSVKIPKILVPYCGFKIIKTR